MKSKPAELSAGLVAIKGAAAPSPDMPGRAGAALTAVPPPAPEAAPVGIIQSRHQAAGAQSKAGARRRRKRPIWRRSISGSRHPSGANSRPTPPPTISSSMSFCGAASRPIANNSATRSKPESTKARKIKGLRVAPIRARAAGVGPALQPFSAAIKDLSASEIL